jgi:PKD repeat protein
MKRSLLALGLSAGFASFGQMTMTSSAMLGSCNCYQLTSTAANDKGAVWSPAPIDLTLPFDMTFNIYAGATDGADGMAFVLQQNATGVGDVGATLGYRDVAPLSVPPISAKSLAIEVDTWNSSPSVPTDIASDHIGIEYNNDNNHNLGGPYPIPDIETGTYHEFRVIWDPSLQIISVLLDGAFIFAYNGDIITNVFTGNPSVYFGWTAASGGVANEHRVCMYRDAAFTPDTTAICPHLPLNFTDNSTSDLNNIVDYSWDFGDGSPLANTQNPMYVYTVPGTYTAELTITDISGCTDVATVNITVLPDLIIDVVGTDVTCFGDTDGQAVATSQNGTGPYSYTWDDPLTQTTQTAIGLLPNTYTVDVVDDLGCTGIGTVTINEPAEFKIIVDATDALCFDSNDGSAAITYQNGVGPFTQIWDDASAQTTQTATNLVPGTYNVTVTDDNGCIATGSAAINAPTEIFITGIVTYDNGTSNGAVDATITGGTTPFYTSTSWSNSATTEDISGVVAGLYTLTVTDTNGCVKDTTFDIRSSVGMAELEATGFEIYPNPTNGIFTIKGTGYYAVTITDASGRIVMNVDAAENTTLDLASFERGIYFVNIEKDGVRHSIRLLRQ